MSVRLTDNTEKIKHALRQGCANGINIALFFWADNSRDLAPRDTGFLAEHIGVTVVATADSLSGEVRSLAPYSGPVNYGTSKQPADPFWTVGGLMTRQKFPNLFRSGFISIQRGTSAGAGVIKSALMDYHGPMGRKGGGF